MTDWNDDAAWFDPENPFEIDAGQINTGIVPVGTYSGMITKAELKRSSKKGTPFVNISVRIQEAEDSQNSGFIGEFVWYEMYITPKTGKMVKRNVEAIEGVPQEGTIRLTDAPTNWPGYEVRFIVEHDESGNEPRAKISRFLNSGSKSSDPTASVGSGGFSL